MLRVKIEDILNIEDRVVFNLLLTEFCNFSCRHCFYSSGPSKPSIYMQNDVLSAIDKNLKLIDIINDRFDDACMYPNINFIGGEPLTNIKKFDEIMEQWFYHYWGERYDFEMTTNGSWLERSPKQVIHILQTLKKMSEYRDDDGVPFVRLSADRFHDEFYRKNYRNLRGDKYLESLLAEYTEEQYTYCTCGSEILWSDEDEYYDEQPYCENCGTVFEVFTIPENLLYVDTFSTSFISTGRALEQVGYSDGLICNSGQTDNIITVATNGNITDMCCRGSQLGNSLPEVNIKNTSAIHALYVWQMFLNDIREVTCSDCNYMSNKFVIDNKNQIIEIINEPICLTDGEVDMIIYPNGDVEM